MTPEERIKAPKVCEHVVMMYEGPSGVCLLCKIKDLEAENEKLKQKLSTAVEALESICQDIYLSEDCLHPKLAKQALEKIGEVK